MNIKKVNTSENRTRYARTVRCKIELLNRTTFNVNANLKFCEFFEAPYKIINFRTNMWIQFEIISKDIFLQFTNFINVLGLLYLIISNIRYGIYIK